MFRFNTPHRAKFLIDKTFLQPFQDGLSLVTTFVPKKKESTHAQARKRGRQRWRPKNLGEVSAPRELQRRSARPKPSEFGANVDYSTLGDPYLTIDVVHST